jgi:TrmH family RNA methyltransferase
MERIESTQNPRIKAAKALHTVKGRDESGLFLCEGEHMVREAVRAADTAYSLGASLTLGPAFAVDTLFVEEALEEKYADLVGEAHAGHAFLVPAHVMQALSTVKSPQGIAAVVRLQTPRIAARDDLAATGLSPAAFGIATGAEALEELEPESEPAQGEPDLEEEISPSVLGMKLVLLENVQDPGNVGTILRTMDAAGFSGAILPPGCAAPFSPKALRATMGSISACLPCRRTARRGPPNA